MKTRIMPTMSLLATAALLAACGGGGGGGGGAQEFPSLDDLPETGVTELQGLAVTATAIADPETFEEMLVDLSDIGESSVLLTTQAGEIVAIAISSEGASPEFNLAEMQSISDTPPYSEFLSDDNLTYLILVTGEERGFDYQSLGTWATDRSPVFANVGTAAYGFRTEASALPVGQRATYRGAGAAAASMSTDRVLLIRSDISVSTDFRTVRIESTGSQFRSRNNDVVEPLPEFDFAGTGPVTGAEFLAEVSGPSLSGQAAGAFHGPNAEEVGGTYRLTGPTGSTLIGAFGALGDGP